jgi:hypothetical protein
MGKKTNWSGAEDQALCRVWLSASDLQLQGSDQKASSFWNVVRELFHQEVDTSVERPLTGLKIRWTRINRDSQKFAAIFNELQSSRMKQTEESGGDAAAVALLTEQAWIDEARDLYHRTYQAKFPFESCWKQLRYSSKWMQLFANSNSSNGSQVLVINPLPTPAVAEVEAHAAPTASSSSTSSEHDITTASTSAAPVPAAASSPPHSSEVTTSSVAAAAVAAATQASDANAYIFQSGHKRRADMSIDSLTNVNQSQQLTATLVDELKRQNDLMEDQNAIALLKVDGDMIADAEARHCFQLLRARYLKKVRTSAHSGYSNSNGRSSTLV